MFRTNIIIRKYERFLTIFLKLDISYNDIRKFLCTMDFLTSLDLHSNDNIGTMILYEFFLNVIIVSSKDIRAEMKEKILVLHSLNFFYSLKLYKWMIFFLSYFLF